MRFKKPQNLPGVGPIRSVKVALQLFFEQLYANERLFRPLYTFKTPDRVPLHFKKVYLANESGFKSAGKRIQGFESLSVLALLRGFRRYWFLHWPHTIR